MVSLLSKPGKVYGRVTIRRVIKFLVFKFFHRPREYGLYCHLVEAINSLYEGSKCWVGIKGIESEWFQIRIGLSQRLVISPWLFNMYIDGVERKTNGRWIL